MAPRRRDFSGVRPGATRGGIGEKHAAREDPAGAPAPSTSKASTTTAAASTSSSSGASEPSTSSGASTPSSSTAAARANAAARPTLPGAAQLGGPASSSAGRPARSVSKVTELGAGLLVAFFVWPMGVNLLKGGPPQMWGWIKAKFINEPYGGPAPNNSGAGIPPGKIPGAYHGHQPGLGRKRG